MTFKADNKLDTAKKVSKYAIFTRLYLYMLELAKHPKAIYYLSFISFIEAVFFPLPPDIMLAPMAVAKPKKYFKIALICAIFSVIGGIFGYLIGYFAFDWINQFIVEFGYEANFKHAINWFEHYGVWVVFIAGFSPIPYKIFTVGAGFMQLFLPGFIISAAISRFLRFILVAKLCAWGGDVLADKMQKYIEYIGYLVVVLLVILYCIFK